jgi:hypothetical protein
VSRTAGEAIHHIPRLTRRKSRKGARRGATLVIVAEKSFAHEMQPPYDLDLLSRIIQSLAGCTPSYRKMPLDAKKLRHGSRIALSAGFSKGITNDADVTNRKLSRIRVIRSIRDFCSVVKAGGRGRPDKGVKARKLLCRLWSVFSI